MENSIKRSLKDGCQYPHTETKKPKAAQVTTTISHPKSSKKIIGFQDLSDEVIMYLFKYLSHDNLAKMALICPNLFRVSNDWTLWKKPRFENFEKSMEGVYLSYLKKDTTELFISCNNVPSHDYSVSHHFLIKLKTKCPELLHLTLKNQVFDEINVNILHPKLKSLTIDSATIENFPANSSFLIDINNTCPDLERIIMKKNDWVMSNFIHPLTRLQRLNYLSLEGCEQFCIPYLSVNAATEFKSLQTLDLRFTPVSDRELVYFKRLPTLKNVLLEGSEYMNHDNLRSTITDVGMAEFCATLSVRYPYVGVLLRGNSERCGIETFYVRNYPKVTDTFLKIAAIHCPYLKLLDIKGSGCTSAQIEIYKVNRPSTKVHYNDQRRLYPSNLSEPDGGTYLVCVVSGWPLIDKEKSHEVTFENGRMAIKDDWTKVMTVSKTVQSSTATSQSLQSG